MRVYARNSARTSLFCPGSDPGGRSAATARGDDCSRKSLRPHPSPLPLRGRGSRIARGGVPPARRSVRHGAARVTETVRPIGATNTADAVRATNASPATDLLPLPACGERVGVRGVLDRHPHPGPLPFGGRGSRFACGGAFRARRIARHRSAPSPRVRGEGWGEGSRKKSDSPNVTSPARMPLRCAGNSLWRHAQPLARATARSQCARISAASAAGIRGSNWRSRRQLLPMSASLCQ